MDTNCLQTRRELSADPNNRMSDVLQHLSSCESCAEFFQGIKSFDEKLKSAVKTDAPEGLESRIILAQRMMNNSEHAESNVIPISKKPSANKPVTNKPITNKQERRDYKWMSLAAALVLAVGLSLGMFKLGESSAVQDEVLAHIGNHLYELEKDENVQLASLNEFLTEHGLTAKEGIGYVRHASNCPIEGKMVPHIIVSCDQGHAVTVMYIPWKDSPKRTPFKNEQFSGVLVGAQKGSFAIVSDNADSLKSVEHRINESMEVRI